MDGNDQEPSMTRIFFATAALAVITMASAAAQPTPQPKIRRLPVRLQ
jgi:hypothetical protein